MKNRIILVIAFTLHFIVIHAQTDKELRVGMSYQGGVIAYVDGSGKHGIIATPYDQSIGANLKTAKKICKKLKLNGYSDWKLPNEKELNILYQNQHKIGGFSMIEKNSRYWSSSRLDRSFYRDQDFENGEQGGGYYIKFLRRVRAIRYF